MTYDRVVAAALAETKSKFRLAEALALDIPARRNGGAVENQQNLETELGQARDRIIAAGGEARSVETLRQYRQAALWVMESGVQLHPTFRWVPGVSYSAHRDAHRFGLTYEQFIAMPSKTVDAVRLMLGRAGTDGQPESIASRWTPEEKAQAARELMKDPATADKVAADPVAASHAAAAIDRHTERQRELQKNVRRDNDDGYPVNPLNLVWEFRQLHRTVDRIAAEVSKRGAIVGPEERDALIDEVAWVRNAMEMIEEGIRGGSVDAALAKILAGEA